MKKRLLFLLIVYGLGACSTAKQTTGQPFGETITAKGAIPYEKLITQMGGVDSLQIKVIGEVSAVCQMKGCWMNMTTGNANQPEMMVKFKDYGFFVPKDIAGRKVVIDGYAYRQVTSVEELRHYAEDAGKSQEEINAITEPAEKLQFLANGVLLLQD